MSCTDEVDLVDELGAAIEEIKVWNEGRWPEPGPISMVEFAKLFLNHQVCMIVRLHSPYRLHLLAY